MRRSGLGATAADLIRTGLDLLEAEQIRQSRQEDAAVPSAPAPLLCSAKTVSRLLDCSASKARELIDTGALGPIVRPFDGVRVYYDQVVLFAKARECARPRDQADAITAQLVNEEPAA